VRGDVRERIAVIPLVLNVKNMAGKINLTISARFQIDFGVNIHGALHGPVHPDKRLFIFAGLCGMRLKRDRKRGFTVPLGLVRPGVNHLVFASKNREVFSWSLQRTALTRPAVAANFKAALRSGKKSCAGIAEQNTILFIHHIDSRILQPVE